MHIRPTIAGLTMTLALAICSCAYFGPSAGLPDPIEEAPPAISSDAPTVKDIACAIDCLEKNVETYGSIVPQHASVWGQSRLMMHRNEFERVMRADIYNFTPTIQGTISTSDQAYLASALSLQAGAGTPSWTDPMTLVSSPNDAITRNQLVKTRRRSRTT
jgi:hypothetical protein